MTSIISTLPLLTSIFTVSLTGGGGGSFLLAVNLRDVHASLLASKQKSSNIQNQIREKSVDRLKDSL